MKTPFLLVLAPAFLLTSGLASPALAEIVCTTVDEFNALMATADQPATAVTVKYDVTGVNPADFAGSKGCLIDFTDNTCTVDNGYASATLKVYGPDDPPNTSHPTGTLKFEYGTDCCPNPPCGEGWADPNASAAVFVDGSEQCQVEAWMDPATYGYKIDCGGGAVFEGVGENFGNLRVDQISLLSLVDGGWTIDNAVSMVNEVCFDQPAMIPGSAVPLDLPVLEDVTASVSSPTTVYADTLDLSVGANDSEIYLKFDTSSVPGLVQKAVIHLHKANTPSSEGDGGDAYAVPDVDWSETTLTWDGRPATAGASLARQSPIATDSWYGWDVSAAIAGPGVYAFAIVPQPSDGNGAHFFSKEASGTLGPYLHLEYVVIDADGDGHPDGPDCDDGEASVFPGATEECNGVDDDCDGEVDQDCAGAGSGGGGGADGAGAGLQGNGVDEADGASSDSGCGCRVARDASDDRGRVALLLALAALGSVIRARTRRTRHSGYAA